MKPARYLSFASRDALNSHRAFIRTHSSDLIKASTLLASCINRGNKVLILGNGGSAADAQHMAAEMVGRLSVDRRPLAAIALTTDSSNLTALGNDFGFENIFSRQVEAIAKPGDIVIAISTSGNSSNVIKAVQVANKKSCFIIGLTGSKGGKLKNLCDVTLSVSANTSASRIQEVHIFAIHSMVDLMDRFFL